MEAKSKGSPQMNHVNEQDEEFKASKRPLSGSGKPRPPLPKKPPKTPKPANLLKKQTSQGSTEDNIDVSILPPKPAPKPSSRGQGSAQLNQNPSCTDVNNQPAEVCLSLPVIKNNIALKNSLSGPAGHKDTVYNQTGCVDNEVSNLSNLDISGLESTVINGQSTDSATNLTNTVNHDASFSDVVSLPGSHGDERLESHSDTCGKGADLKPSTNSSVSVPRQQKTPPTISPKPKKSSFLEANSDKNVKDANCSYDKLIVSKGNVNDQSVTGHCTSGESRSDQHDKSTTGSVLSRVAEFSKSPKLETGSPNSGRRRLLQWQPDKNKFMETDNACTSSLNSYGSQKKLSTDSHNYKNSTTYKTVRSQSFQNLYEGSDRHMWTKGGRMNQSLDSGYCEPKSFESEDKKTDTNLNLSSDDSNTPQIHVVQRSKSSVTRIPPKPKPRQSLTPRPLPTPRKGNSYNKTDSEDLTKTFLAQENVDSVSVAEGDMMCKEESVLVSNVKSNIKQEMVDVSGATKEEKNSSQDEQNVRIQKINLSPVVERDINANEYPKLDMSVEATPVTPASPPPPAVPPKLTDSSSKYKDFSKSDFSSPIPNDDTSSLLSDIEHMLSKAFPFYFDSNSRPRSIGASETPVRPPRHKKMNKKADGQSDSDSELLAVENSDSSFKGSTQSLNAISDDVTRRKKQCPPKPVRKKLCINRSHSDVGDMRQLVLLKETSESKRVSTEKERNSTGNMPSTRDCVSPLMLGGQSGILSPDFCVPANQEKIIRERMERSRSLPSNRKLQTGIDDKSNRNEKLPKSHKKRPIRPAPPPPNLKQVKNDPLGHSSKSLSSSNKAKVNLSNSEHLSNNVFASSAVSLDLEKTRGDRHSSGESDENEYHEIPNDLWKGGEIQRQSPEKSLNYLSSDYQDKEGSPIPPQLPPRNDPEHTGSVLSVVSNSDSGSAGHGSMIQESSSSEDEEEDPEIRKERRRQKKVFYIAREMATSEKVFVDVLQLLNVDFRKHISIATEEADRPVIPQEVLNKILSHLPQLHSFNVDLLKDLEYRVQHWDEKQEIADIFVKKGPFLKLYTSYIQDFSEMCAVLDDATKKMPLFQAALKEFELSPRCACLAVRHYMLKPIQRIPQYRLMLTDYRKHLLPDSPDYENTTEALRVVSKVADHANESMKQGDQVQKMLEIQKSLDGHFEVIKPGRIFLKSGELMKLSRKEMQPRMFFLFNDVLLYTMPNSVGGYRLKNALTLVGMKVTKNKLDELKTEFSIISLQRSFTVEARSPDERDEWIEALTKAINDHVQKRNTFETGTHNQQATYDKDFVLGAKPPVWIPDSRVTMCMMCTSEFSVTLRRHHCRACGKVVCYNCSYNKAPLAHTQNKSVRVCDDCFEKLKAADPSIVETVMDEGDPEPQSFIGSITDMLFRKSGRPRRPARLREVHANDQGSTISGNLKILQGRKWKKCWFVVKDRVLYTYKAMEDMAAIDSMPILGYDVDGFTEYHEGVHSTLLFQLKHKNRPPVIFQTDRASTTNKWVKAMKEATQVDA